MPTAISSLSPAFGPLAGGGAVQISGSGFTGATAVSFGGTAANFSVASDNQITVYAPPHTAGTVDVTVTTPGGTSPTSASDHFTFTPPPPTAANDSYSLLHDNTRSISAASGVLANDTSPGGLPLSAVLAMSPQHGTVALHSDGSFIYTPNAGYAGSDGFSYYAVAGGQHSNTAGVMLTVTDQAPVATADSYSGLHDQVLTASAGAGSSPTTSTPTAMLLPRPRFPNPLTGHWPSTATVPSATRPRPVTLDRTTSPTPPAMESSRADP